MGGIIFSCLVVALMIGIKMRDREYDVVMLDR